MAMFYWPLDHTILSSRTIPRQKESGLYSTDIDMDVSNSYTVPANPPGSYFNSQSLGLT